MKAETYSIPNFLLWQYDLLSDSPQKPDFRARSLGFLRFLKGAIAPPLFIIHAKKFFLHETYDWKSQKCIYFFRKMKYPRAFLALRNMKNDVLIEICND